MKLKEVKAEVLDEVQGKNEVLRQLGYQTSLRKSMELAFETQKDLVKSKEEIIENLKTIVDNLKKDACGCKQHGGEVLTSNYDSNSTTEKNGEQDKKDTKKGV